MHKHNLHLFLEHWLLPEWRKPQLVPICDAGKNVTVRESPAPAMFGWLSRMIAKIKTLALFCSSHTLLISLLLCSLLHPVLYNNISTPNLTPSIEHTINVWWSFRRMNRVTQQGTQTLSFFVLLWFSFWLYDWLLGLHTGAIALRETSAALFGQL